MAAPELATTLASASQRAPRLSPPAFCIAFAGLWIATALGVGAELLDPGLIGATPPHPTLHATAAAIASVFTTNLRVLALPFLLIAVGCHTNRITRAAGDLSLAAVLAVNAFRVGVAIGRWRMALVPYLPHLPLEYAAIAVAAGAWIKVRQQTRGQNGGGEHAKTGRPRGRSGRAGMVVSWGGVAPGSAGHDVPSVGASQE